MLGYRSNDAVLTICQNNEAKSIEIVSVNEAASALIGYVTDELAGRALAQLIPERFGTLLTEYVEYEEDANDVGMVLSKVQSFGMYAKDLKEKSFRLKVVRGHCTKEKLTFRLVLQDAVDMRKDDALQKMIQDNFKGHEVLHPLLGIPDLHSLEKDMELVAYYHHKAQLCASFVMMQLDHGATLEQQYGEALSVEFLRHVAHICRANLRPGDVVGAVSDIQLGVLLLGSVSDATRMVSNRLRWQIAAQPFILPDKTVLNLSASMVFANITGALTPEKILEACAVKLIAIPDHASSQLLEA